MFSNRERAKRARVSAPQWEWYLTCVQHIFDSCISDAYATTVVAYNQVTADLCTLQRSCDSSAALKKLSATPLHYPLRRDRDARGAHGHPPPGRPCKRACGRSSISRTARDQDLLLFFAHGDHILVDLETRNEPLAVSTKQLPDAVS